MAKQSGTCQGCACHGCGACLLLVPITFHAREDIICTGCGAVHRLVRTMDGFLELDAAPEGRQGDEVEHAAREEE